jgi:CubicO group peptidase (beta-lactamase class C family)
MKRFLGPVAALLLCAPAFAFAEDSKAPATLPQLDARLAAMFREGAIPGASVALIENGKIVFAKGYGSADVANHVRATADTPFRAGSISKSVTSIAIMTLVEQHKLSLDARLADLAPEVHFVNRWEKSDPVRLVNLLEHTTGWPDISTRVLAKDEKDWSGLQGVQFTSSEFVSRWQPGRFTVYNNAGPAVAGVVLEKVSGRRFEDYARDTVLRPMGMATADFDLTPDLARRIARSYGPGGTITPYQYIVLKPAGSLNVSARELAQLARFYLGRGTVDGHRILSPESVARIERSESNLAAKDGFSEGYALGNAIFPDSGPTFRGHNGSIDSFTAVMGYNVKSNSGYVLMANGGEGVDFAAPVAHLVQSYLTRGLKMQPKPAMKLSKAALEDYAGLYRVITPPNRLLQPYTDIIGISRVQAADGKLIVSGNDFFPVSAHVFRRFDREDASLAFVKDRDSVYKLGAFNAAVKTSFLLVALIFVTVAVIALGALTGLVMLIPWIVAAARGRLAERGGIVMRVLPLASIATLAVTMALPFLAASDAGATAVAQLASIGPYSLAVAVCSVLFPLLALGGLILALRNKEANIFIRGYAAKVSIALLIAAGYLVSVGWMPALTWNM